MPNFSEISALLGIAVLLGGLIFNAALLWFRVKDLEDDFKDSIESAREKNNQLNLEIKEVNNRLNRLINKGNRKLGWDFEFYNDDKPRQ